MRTCRRSTNSNWRRVAACAVLLLPGFSTLSAAQVLAESPPSGARARAAAEGDTAMQRLRSAIAGQKAGVRSPLPSSRPSPTDAERRQAIEALRKRMTSPAMDARARAALEKSKESFAAERENMARRLQEALGLEVPEMMAVAGATQPSTAKAWVPMLFASSSIPVPILRTYAGQLERVGGVIAFRGMPGGLTKVGPMAKLSVEILRIDPGCEGSACAMRNVQLIVDPLVFRQHAVARVPALAMVPSDPTQPYCEREEGSLRASHVIYGDAALSGLLEEYARLGGKKEVRDAQARLERR